MPLAPTPCAERTCTNLATYRGKCQIHQPQAWRGSTRKQRLPKDWKTRREIVLRQHRGICYICGKPNADAIDHIVAGDDHSLENLAPVHEKVPPYCHRYKSSKEGIDARSSDKEKGLPNKGYYRPNWY